MHFLWLLFGHLNHHYAHHSHTSATRSPPTSMQHNLKPLNSSNLLTSSLRNLNPKQMHAGDMPGMPAAVGATCLYLYHGSAAGLRKAPISSSKSGPTKSHLRTAPKWPKCANHAEMMNKAVLRTARTYPVWLASSHNSPPMHLTCKLNKLEHHSMQNV